MYNLKEDFVSCGSETEAKKLGKCKIEGPNYIIQDGDICNFKFKG